MGDYWELLASAGEWPGETGRFDMHLGIVQGAQRVRSTATGQEQLRIASKAGGERSDTVQRVVCFDDDEARHLRDLLNQIYAEE